MIYRFTTWKFVCPVEGQTLKSLQWSYDASPRCPVCQGEMALAVPGPSRAPAIHGDEIDVTVEHGPCNSDGSPRRYRSRSELRDTARAQGLIHASEYGEVGSKWNPKPDLRAVHGKGRHATPQG